MIKYILSQMVLRRQSINELEDDDPLRARLNLSNYPEMNQEA